MKKYLKRFVRNEEGSELIQWAVVIVIAVALAVIAYAISETMSDKLNDAKTQLDQIGGATSAAPAAPTGITPP